MQEREELVEGFYFEDPELARKAKKEYMYIERMKDRVSALSPEGLKEFYHKLLEKDIFSTQVGYTYLYEIRSALIENYHMSEEELAVIPIPGTVAEEPNKEKMQADQGDEVRALKRTRTLLSAAVVVLIGVVIGFFIILATNQNIGYINTENKILNKYSQWQEELDAREQALDEREEALDEREADQEEKK